MGSLLSRIIAKLDVGDCWVFTGARMPSGYGVIGIGASRTDLAHRALYRVLVGEIAPGIDLDHLCRNRACCNPDHLEPVTRQQNVDRGARSKGWSRRGNRLCAKGHEMTAENTYDYGTFRQCRRCALNRARARREARTEIGAPIIAPTTSTFRLAREA